MFCHVASEQVIGVHDVSSVYHVPLLLQSQRIVEYLRKRLNLASLNITEEWVSKGLSLEAKWRGVTKGYYHFSPPTIASHFPLFRQERLFDEVKIVLVGKYTDLKDSYMSVIKALEHSAFRVRRKLTIQVGCVGPPRTNDSVMFRSGLSHRTWSLQRRSLILLNTTMRGEQLLVLGK